MDDLEWRPHDGPQTDFLEAVASGEYYEIFYGGSRGGGKTDGGIMCLLYDKEYPLYRALVIRRNAEDLKDWSDRASRWYESQGAKRAGNPPDFTFPKGSKIRSGHLKDENAYSKYQGHEYHKMLIEELPQIPAEENYLKLIASCRSTVPELRPCVISNGNPDGPGFTWVRKRFRIAGTPRKPIVTIDPVTGLKRIFIPARLSDNPTLEKNDPGYRKMLTGLPDGLRQAWLDGCWDDPVIKGAYYTRELAQARKEKRIKLVPHDPTLKTHTIWDLGIDDSMSIGFVQRISTETRFVDYYENQNFGLAHYHDILKERSHTKGYNYGKHFAPFDINKRELSSGQSILHTAEQMNLKFEVVPMVSRAAGIQKVRLMWPRIYINEEVCDQMLSAWRNYRKEWDEKLLRFKDEPVHDWSSHAADMLRHTALVEKLLTNEDEPKEDTRIKTAPPVSKYEGKVPLHQEDNDELTDDELGRM